MTPRRRRRRPGDRRRRRLLRGQLGRRLRRLLECLLAGTCSSGSPRPTWAISGCRGVSWPTVVLSSVYTDHANSHSAHARAIRKQPTVSVDACDTSSSAPTSIVTRNMIDVTQVSHVTCSTWCSSSNEQRRR